MNSDLWRPAAIFLILASLFLIGCKDNKPSEPPKAETNSEQVEAMEPEITEEDPDAEAITEPPPVVREAQLYSPRTFPSLQVIYGQ
jgi:hypothetical protein